MSRPIWILIAKNLQSEIAMMRVVTRRVMELAGGVEDLDSAMNILGTLGLAAMRLAGLLKAQKLICGSHGDEDLAKAISDALSEVVQEMKLL